LVVAVVVVAVVDTLTTIILIMFLRKTVLYVAFLTSVAASGNLRQHMQGEGCPHAQLFRAWTETHGKDYPSEEYKDERMKVWVENNRKLTTIVACLYRMAGKRGPKEVQGCFRAMVIFQLLHVLGGISRGSGSTETCVEFYTNSDSDTYGLDLVLVRPRIIPFSYHYHHLSSGRIEAHNNQEPKPKYLLGHNEYSDMTSEEFAQHFKLGKYSGAEFAKSAAQGRLSKTFKSMPERHLVQDRPAEINWIALGGVTPVKNQVSLTGTCYFAVV
jgi:hypothetical protein